MIDNKNNLDRGSALTLPQQAGVLSTHPTPVGVWLAYDRLR